MSNIERMIDGITRNLIETNPFIGYYFQTSFRELRRNACVTVYERIDNALHSVYIQMIEYMQTIFELESQLYASLAHPKRLEILHLLSHGSLTVNQIVEMTNLSQANVSQHLMLLRSLGLVEVTKHGQVREYTLATKLVTHTLSAIRLLVRERFGRDETTELAAAHPFVDPVCGMEVTVHTAASSLVHAHKRYYFCASGCAHRFQKDPSRFLRTSHSSVHIAKGNL